MFFRKALVRIRRYYETQRSKLFLISALVVAGSVGAGVAGDALLPFTTGWNLLRTVLLIPTAGSVFILGYAASLWLHHWQRGRNPDWVPLRARVSPTWRRRISAVVAALMFVLVAAVNYNVGYTLISSLFVAVVIALFAFMRTTREENQREAFGIPDIRDTRFEQERRKAADKRRALIEERKTSRGRKTKVKRTEEEDELS
jgi:hypothetical protein